MSINPCIFAHIDTEMEIIALQKLEAEVVEVKIGARVRAREKVLDLKMWKEGMVYTLRQFLSLCPRN